MHHWLYFMKINRFKGSCAGCQEYIGNCDSFRYFSECVSRNPRRRFRIGWIRIGIAHHGRQHRCRPCWCGNVRSSHSLSPRKPYTLFSSRCRSRKVGMDGRMLLDPTENERQSSDFELLIAGHPSTHQVHILS